MLLIQSPVYLGVILSLLYWPCAQGIPWKQGDCPKVRPVISVDAICSEECVSDMDCPDDLKCCSNGCGRVCMKPDLDICSQPKVVGPCDGYFPRWFFNTATRLCEKFIYGGCGGNGNNFKTKLECKKKCGESLSHCPPGTKESRKKTYCGRGGTRCDSGFYCEIAPDDSFAVCCSKPEPTIVLDEELNWG